MTDTPTGMSVMVLPATGEAIDLAGPLPEIARALSDIRDLEMDLRAAKGHLSFEVHRRMDKQRLWTLREGAHELSGESDAPKVEWHGDALWQTLDALVAEDLITPEARDAAVETVVDYKVKRRGLNALLKNPAIGERIRGCSEERPAEERTRRVTVRPA